MAPTWLVAVARAIVSAARFFFGAYPEPAPAPIPGAPGPVLLAIIKESENVFTIQATAPEPAASDVAIVATTIHYAVNGGPTAVIDTTPGSKVTFAAEALTDTITASATQTNAGGGVSGPGPVTGPITVADILKGTTPDAPGAVALAVVPNPAPAA